MAEGWALEPGLTKSPELPRDDNRTHLLGCVKGLNVVLRLKSEPGTQQAIRLPWLLPNL